MFLKRNQLAELIPVSATTSNRWFPPTKSGYINGKTIIEMLNAHRRNGQPEVVGWIPHLMTTRQFGEQLGRDGNVKPVSERTVRNWCVSAPHFRIENTILIDAATMYAWMTSPETEGRVSPVV